MTIKRIAVLAGDGIGPEIMEEGLRLLKAVTANSPIKFETTEALIGGAAFAEYGSHFPPATEQICNASDAILFGAVGGPVGASGDPKWTNCEVNSILALRKRYQLQVNLRPTAIYPELVALSPLKPERIGSGVDLIIVRELVGDVYFGEHRTYLEDGIRKASDLGQYDESQIRAAAHAAYKAAGVRKRRVSSVDKANVLDTSKLWRCVVSEVSLEYPEITLEHVLVDNAAMLLARDPQRFDVLLTSNLFGDILSDLAAALSGSLGLAPSASLSSSGFGLFEPISGSAQDIAGKGIANPIGQILSVAMMLRYSFGLESEARRIEQAVQIALRSGARTGDIAREGETKISTKEMSSRIIAAL